MKTTKCARAQHGPDRTLFTDTQITLRFSCDRQKHKTWLLCCWGRHWTACTIWTAAWVCETIHSFVQCHSVSIKLHHIISEYHAPSLLYSMFHHKSSELLSRVYARACVFVCANLLNSWAFKILPSWIKYVIYSAPLPAEISLLGQSYRHVTASWVGGKETLFPCQQPLPTYGHCFLAQKPI